MSVIVYALTNPAMPGLVKIGKTSRGDPQARMKELYSSSGVPLPFECIIAVEVEDDPDGGLEKVIHTVFAPYRLNPSREFFQIEPLQVEALLKAWPGKDVTPQVNKEAEEELDDSDREAVKQFRLGRHYYRTTYMRFGEMGISTGSVLVSVDTGEEARVNGDRKVFFRGDVVSLTEATRAALDLEPGRTPQKSTSHWTFDGRNLAEIFDQTYRVKEA